MAHKIEVALGASETIRNGGFPPRLVFIATLRDNQTGWFTCLSSALD